MRVGIDLDNTLVRYDEVFMEAANIDGLTSGMELNSKRQVREFIRSKPDGEGSWQKLQGQVYGKLMNRATLMPDVSWFLYRCRYSGVMVNIVSHKTEYGHQDSDRIPLRETALDWMERNGFFDKDIYGLSRKDVYFEDTRKKKVDRIATLDLSFFVDDLPEVFLEPNFPGGTKKILFVPNRDTEDLVVPEGVTECVGWAKVAKVLLGEETHNDHLYIAREILHDFSVVDCSIAAAGRNSGVYRVQLAEGHSVSLKRYPATVTDKRDRLGTEFRACQFLHREGITVVPKALRLDRRTNVGIFEWIDGDPILVPDDAALEQAVSLLHAIQQTINSDAAKSMPLASEACLSGDELVRQIRTRRNRLSSPAEQYPTLHRYLVDVFDPLFEVVLHRALEKWPSEINFYEDIPKETQILSLSDFGFHNALRDHSGRIRFLDLEYFGWDDPVKLICDFWWHPGMNLNKKLKKAWLDQSLMVFTDDRLLRSRINAVHPAYGLRWALIVLNSFIDEKVALKDQANSGLEAQMETSTKLLSIVKDWIGNEKQVV